MIFKRLSRDRRAILKIFKKSIRNNCFPSKAARVSSLVTKIIVNTFILKIIKFILINHFTNNEVLKTSRILKPTAINYVTNNKVLKTRRNTTVCYKNVREIAHDTLAVMKEAYISLSSFFQHT